jgi:hypothetical protein
MPFPPPLKEPLSSYEAQSPALGETSPPPGTTFALLGLYPSPPPPVLPSSEDDSCRIERRELSYLSYILASWQRRILTLPEDTFPTFEQVTDRQFVTDTYHVTYAHAGAEWRSSHRIKRLNDQRILIVHLANDGYLYFNPDDLTVDEVANRRHPTCNAGWKVFKTGIPASMVKEKLRDFREFADAWFGTPKIRMSVLYNSESCRVDICFLTKDEAVGLEFSFEADSPLPPPTPGVSLWWD